MAPEFERRWNGLLPVGVVEHHALRDRSLSVYDICDRLVPVHERALELHGHTELDRPSVMKINHSVTDALGQPDGSFENEQQWEQLIQMIEECGGFAEDPAHISGWIFSSLYWDHLTVCQFATAWIYTDAIRAKHQMPKLELAMQNLGRFLWSLSGAGPPINDGQTFFPDQYGS